MLTDEPLFLWLIDLGNSHVKFLDKNNTIVTDHHYSRDYYINSINPFYYHIDGETEISGSGLVYMVVKHLIDIKPNLPIIGALGDLQDIKYCKLVGLNRELLNQSTIASKEDIRLYGKNDPLFKMMAHASDPKIPGLFKQYRNTIGFLKKIKIDHKLTWLDCTEKQKKTILSSIIKHLVKNGVEYDNILRIYGETYFYNDKDAREYATILNSLGKYGEGLSAVSMCISGKFEREKLIKQHKKKISNYIGYAKNKIEPYGNFYYFHGDKYIIDTVIGTIAGLLLREGGYSNPVIAFAENDEGIKISGRAPLKLTEKGLNLSLAMKNTARTCGGDGGGHRAAAGALIPKGSEEKFLDLFSTELRCQLTL